MKTFRGTGLFVLFVVGLALVSYFLVYQGEKKKSESKEKASVVIPFKAEDVTELVVEANGNKLQLKKVENEWRLVSPVDYPADPAEAKSFVENVLGERSIDEIRDDEGVPWNVFGLDKPAGSVTVTDQSGQTKKVLISTRKTYNNDIYLRYEDANKVLLASGTWTNYLTKEAKGLRDKRVYRGDPAKISEVLIKTFKNGSPVNIHLVRSPEKKWHFKGDAQTLIDSSEVSKFLDQVQATRVLDFVAEDHENDADLKKFDLTSSQLTKIDFVDEGGKASNPSWSLSLSPVNKDGHAYLVTSDLKPILEIFKTSAERLQPETGDFRDKAAPFQFKADQVRKLTYRSPMFSTDLVKENGTWRLKETKDGEDVAKDQVDSLIKGLANLRVKKYLGHTKAKGLNPPKYLVSLRDGEDKLLISVKWGDEFKEDKTDPAAMVYATTSEAKEVLALEAAKVKELPGQTLLKQKAEKVPPKDSKATPPAVSQEKPKDAGA